MLLAHVEPIAHRDEAVDLDSIATGKILFRIGPSTTSYRIAPPEVPVYELDASG